MHQTLLERQMENEEKEKACLCCTRFRLTGFALLFFLMGLTLALVATFVPRLIEHKLESGIDDYVSLAPSAQEKGSDGFITFSDNTGEDAVPVYHTVYMFNITNPAEILLGAHPSVTQHGPYTYREYKKKFDFTYTADYNNRQVLQYKQWTYWEYDPSQSASGLDPLKDKYTSVNMAIQGVTHAPGISLFWQDIVAGCPGQYDTDFQRMFIQHATVEEMLFGYFECALYSIVPAGLNPKGYFPGILGANARPSVNVTQDWVGARTLYDSIYTGTDDPDFTRQYYTYQEQMFLTTGISPLWGSGDANRVYGTSGDMFKRDLKDGSTVVAFVSDLTRHAPIVNLNSEHVDLHDISLRRYSLDPKMLLNTTYVPANADYYMGVHNGLLDLSKTKEGLPLFMSKPHFLSADPELAADIVGMHPDPTLHDTFLDVEPITGVTMRAHKRLQLNILQKPQIVGSPQSKITWYPNITLHYTPVAWIDENAQITSSKAESFRDSVYGALTAIKYIRLLGAIFGSLFLAVSFYLLVVAASRNVVVAQPKSDEVNIKMSLQKLGID